MAPLEKDTLVQFYSMFGHILNNTKYLYWINLATFMLYLIDKLFYMAGCQRIRIPEYWLLSLSFMGGVPSAMLASRLINTKYKIKSNTANLIKNVVLHCIIAAVPCFYVKEYRYLYSRLVMPQSLTKDNFGALSYYVPFYGLTFVIFYGLGLLINVLQIIFSPIIFVVNLIVFVMRFVLLAGFCGIALTLILNAYQSPANVFANIGHYWNLAVENAKENMENS